MATLSLVLLIGSVVSIALLASYLDAKFHWRLNDWMNGACSNPFIAPNQKALHKEIQQKDTQIDALQARIETLEAIVTEPTYELNRKINNL